MEPHYFTLIGLLAGFLADQLLGDPEKLPHPIVGFGKTIALGEKYLNKGNYRMLKGALMTIVLVVGVFGVTHLFFNISLTDKMKFSDEFRVWLFMWIIFQTIIIAIIVFYCLSARTLRNEVRMVFEATDRSTEAGRKQLSRIVGRDTATLEPQQIRTAALETLAENLSDGVIAPLFWFALLGVPGMLAYKMINTLDSMIGYKNDRYFYFGKFAARLDDVANYVPARLTALFMLVVSGKLSKTGFVLDNGKKHSSPNSGYPEAALAGILNSRFGGSNYYFGSLVEKPYIGHNDRCISTQDMTEAIQVNLRVEWMMLILVGFLIMIL